MWFGTMRFCKTHKGQMVTVTELDAWKYIQGRFCRLSRYKYTNPIMDYSKLNVTFSAMKVANYISENGKLYQGESFVYYLMLGYYSKIDSALDIKQIKKKINKV